jgi:hypothetical protein
MSRKLAAALAALCLLAAGCGGVAADGRTAARQTDASETLAAAANRRLAVQEALRLLSVLPVPAHAVRLKSAPAALPVDGLSTPASSPIDASRSWLIPLPYKAAATWLVDNPPDLQVSGSLQGSRFGHPWTGYSYAGLSGPAWASAELDVEVAPAGPRGSVMRADGLVIWIDPGPAPDNTVGLRLRVAAASGCPVSDHGVVGVTNPGAKLTRSLLPAGQPTAGLECQYYGMNVSPWRLHTQRHLSAGQARRLAATLAALPLGYPVGEGLNPGGCPADESAELIVLAYPGRPDVDLWMTGCNDDVVANGYIVA